MAQTGMGTRVTFALGLLANVVSFAPSASAVSVTQSTSARIDYTTVTAGSWDIGGFYFVLGPDGFGLGDTIKLDIFDSNNVQLASSGPFGGNDPEEFEIGILANFFPNLSTASFYAIVSAPTGSFDVTGAGPRTEVANQDTRQNAFPQFSEVQAVQATPIPGALPLFATGLGALGFLTYRRQRKKAA